jgi:hypothetical protein
MAAAAAAAAGGGGGGGGGMGGGDSASKRDRLERRLPFCPSLFVAPFPSHLCVGLDPQRTSRPRAVFCVWACMRVHVCDCTHTHAHTHSHTHSFTQGKNVENTCSKTLLSVCLVSKHLF